ncbi:hypothetical protein GCM10025867_48620 (plasmid) [Frondihabitans sucicola]|uniref:DUF4325 domain-containing protein n=1 Tax=Frondihabitans sucicola TaxID=1268041 RepID=A0ABM8GVZ1_9MICO|nr:hypothetical protein [Frondihabitans sucicola]BDZ52621.1 hypothetical protein GCM10025867_48620 [Frondihabitans sucicola]
MGRPAKLSARLISVSVDGKGAAWCDGEFSGDPEIIEYARRCILFNTEIDVMGIPMVADNVDMFGALAALYAFSPGRTILIEAPERIRALLDEEDESDTPEDLDLWSA